MAFKGQKRLKKVKICQAELQSLLAGKTKTNRRQLDTHTAGSTHYLVYVETPKQSHFFEFVT